MTEFNENTITKTLRLSSDKSESSSEFKAGLLLKLEDELTPKQKYNFNLSFLSMKNLVLPVAAIATLAVIATAGGAAYLTTRDNNDKQENTVAYDYDTASTTSIGEQPDDLSSGLRIATDFHKTIAEAQTKTSFTMKRATMRVGNEALYTIETTTDFPGSDPNMDSYFLTYTENGKTVYKVSGMSSEREVIEGEEVSINGMKAYYYKVPADQLVDGEDITIDQYGPSARSFVYWNEGGRSYDVSEFTGMSKEALLELAASVK